MCGFGGILQDRLNLSVEFLLLHSVSLHTVKLVLTVPLYQFSCSDDGASQILLEIHIPFFLHHDFKI